MSAVTQCKATRNGYECSRPEHNGSGHDFPLVAYSMPEMASPMTSGYRVTRHASTDQDFHERWGITFRTSHGTDIAAGSVSRKGSEWAVWFDSGRPCQRHTQAWDARMAAVQRYSRAVSA
jgi:hypothetical protein